MDLTFLGRGAAFNPKEGNTSAYFIENKKLFLIDCGESVFERIIENDLLKDIEVINLMITHTHSDHIGSIGSLVMYSFFTLQKPINIILPNHEEYIVHIKNILNAFGCFESMYKIVLENEFDNKYERFTNIRYLKTNHYNGLICYSLLFNTPNGIIYYSGDTRETTIIEELIRGKENIDKLYIDVTTADFKGNVHIYIGILKDIIPENLKNCVYCMHFNNDECIEKAKELGFNVVEVKNNFLTKRIK